MGWTKRQFISAAFEEIDMAEYVFDIGPSELDGALRRLDALMAEWNGLGIQLGYPMVRDPDNADIDSETNVPISSSNAVFANLAIRLAPSYGKTPSNETKTAAKNGYNILFARATQAPSMQFARFTPSGAGNKSWTGMPNPFLIPPAEPDLGTPDQGIELPEGL